MKLFKMNFEAKSMKISRFYIILGDMLHSNSAMLQALLFPYIYLYLSPPSIFSYFSAYPNRPVIFLMPKLLLPQNSFLIFVQFILLSSFSLCQNITLLWKLACSIVHQRYLSSVYESSFLFLIFFIFNFSFFIEVQLTYKITLVPGVLHSDLTFIYITNLSP